MGILGGSQENIVLFLTLLLADHGQITSSLYAPASVKLGECYRPLLQSSWGSNTEKY